MVDYRILTAGDTAMVVEFGDSIEPELVIEPKLVIEPARGLAPDETGAAR